MRIASVSALVALTMAIVIPTLFAADSDDYLIPADVIGGGGVGRSDKYILDDAIGEPVIGEGISNDYQLDSGYISGAAPSASLSVACDATSLSLGTLLPGDEGSGSVLCTVTSSVPGYALRWQVPTGSGGAFTGSLISQYNQTIEPYSSMVDDMPETWSVSPTETEWGGRVQSISTDAGAEWGTDVDDEKWLDISTTGRTIVSRTTETTGGGSMVRLQIRAAIGAGSNKTAGTYRTTIVLTVLGEGL